MNVDGQVGDCHLEVAVSIVNSSEQLDMKRSSER